MLERVSPSAECAAHIFLRRFEAPIRSNRILGSAFWKSGSENIDIPTWWPSYLDSVRSKSQVAPCVPHSRFSNSHGPPIAPRFRDSKLLNHSTRTFTNSTSTSQVAAAQASLEQDDNPEAKSYAGRKKLDSDTGRAVILEDYKSTQSNILQKAQSHGRGETQLTKAWNHFMKTDQKNNASTLVHSLATGKHVRHLDRALRAFRLIPKSCRTAKDYRTAVEISTRLGRYSVALDLMKQAVAQERGEGIFFDFLAFCVSNSLWATAAELWRTFSEDELRSAASASTSYKRNFAGRFISSFDIVPDLPLQVVTLANRLSENDPILFPYYTSLRELCKKLALLTVENEKAMGLITENGIVALLGVQRKLQFNSWLHVAALATLHRMSKKRIRSELAILIYKDFRSAQGSNIPKWIIGTMIDICSVGENRPAIYRSLLNDYRQVYGTPEKDIYLRVMRACATQGEVDAVSEFFMEFSKYFQPSVADDLNPLIRAHAVTGDHQGAQKHFDRVVTEFGLKQSVMNWNTLILAHDRAGDYNQAYQKFREMQHNQFTPDEYTWSMLVALASKRGDTKHARDFVAEAQKAGKKPSLPMIGAVVDSCLLNGDTKEALSLVTKTTQALQLGSFQESPTRLWNSLLRFHAFKGDSKAIVRTEEQMKRSGVKPDGMTYAALMTALVVQGRTDDAAQILRTLNFSQVLNATAFHYSILIHGYAIERKRDRAQVLYNEMITNFPRATPSAKLAMLHLQSTRDEEQARTEYLAGGPNLKPDFRPTLENLREILAETSSSDIVSSARNPGFGRKSSPGDLERVYLGTLIKFLHRNSAYDSSQMILQTLTESPGSLAPNMTVMKPSWSSALSALSNELEAAIEAQTWVSVSRIWQQIVDVALENCVPMRKRDHSPIAESPTVPATFNLTLVEGAASQFSGMIPQASKPSNSVLPAHQYVLSRPLSQYIVALDRQQNYEQLITTTQELRGHGFNLSGKNWNSLIQALCRSPNKRHGVFAFQLFESILLKNAPSWDVIRRGQWVLPSKELRRHEPDKFLKRKDGRKSRKLMEKSMPNLAMPTYYTMVHLARVWLNVSSSSSKDDHTIRRELETRSPGTVKLVMKAPYIQDRVQGTLLRGRQVVGDPSKRPRQPKEGIGFAGIQGSQLLVDQISPEARIRVETSITLNDDDVQNNDLEKAESLLGQITRSPVILPSKGRFETHQERRKRIAIATRRKLLDYANLVTQIRKDSELGLPMVGTLARGQLSSGYRDVIPQASDKNKDDVFDEQQSATFRKVNAILRHIGTKPLHNLSAIHARRRKSKVRTTTLSRAQAVRLGVSPTEQDFLIARILRMRKHIKTSKVPKLMLGKSLPRREMALKPKSMPPWKIVKSKRLSRNGTARPTAVRAHPAKGTARHVAAWSVKRRLLQFKPKASAISDKSSMAIFKTPLRRIGRDDYSGLKQ